MEYLGEYWWGKEQETWFSKISLLAKSAIKRGGCKETIEKKVSVCLVLPTTEGFNKSRKQRISKQVK